MLRRKKAVAVVIVLALVALPAAIALAKKAPIDVHGTTWHMYSKVQLKVQKVGGFKDVDENMLYIGPNAAQSLDPDEFKITSMAGGDTYTGTWTDPKGNGSIILNIDPADMEDALLGDVVNLLQTEYSSVMMVQVDITKMKVKCKLKPGKKGSASVTANFIGSGVLDGEYQEGKGKFAIKGKGTEEF